MGKEWYGKAQDFIQDEAHPEKWIHKTTPVVFWAYWPMCQMDYAETLAKEGIFGEKAEHAWQQAASDWTIFAKRQIPGIPTPNRPEPGMVRLGDKEQWLATVQSSIDRLEQLRPGLRDELVKQRLDGLTAAERKIYDTPPEKLTAKELEQAGSIAKKLRVSHEDVAFDSRMPAERRAEAIKLAREIVEAEGRVYEINSQRTIANFDYWKRKADFEQTRDAWQAREAVYNAERKAEGQFFSEAAKLYAEAFAKWRLVLDNPKWPDLKNQEQFGGELVDLIRDYRKVLEKETPPMPFSKEGFILKDILDLHEATTPVRVD